MSVSRKVNVPLRGSAIACSVTGRAGARRLRDRQPGTQGEAALGPRSRLELPAVDGDALAHPDQPVPARVAVAAAATVVADRHLELAAVVTDDHFRMLGAGVLCRVRQPLL